MKFIENLTTDSIGQSGQRCKLEDVKMGCGGGWGLKPEGQAVGSGQGLNFDMNVVASSNLLLGNGIPGNRQLLTLSSLHEKLHATNSL